MPDVGSSPIPGARITMKKATKLKKISKVFIDKTWNHKISKDEAEKLLTELLCDAYCLTTDDYPKSTLCAHGVRFDRECDECNKL